MTTKQLLKRLLERCEVNEETGCWEWTAGTFGGRYGQFKVERQPMLAHRLSYEVHKGKFPQYLQVCHTCDNGLCINPDHLFLGTSLTNNRDKIAKGRDNYCYGANRPDAKFTMAQVRRIREFSLVGIATSELAKFFKVNAETIRKIILHKSYKEEFA